MSILSTVLKKAEKAARPLVKVAANVIPGGNTVLNAQREIKAIADKIKSKDGRAEIVAGTKANIASTEKAAQAVGAVNDAKADLATLNAKQPWFLPAAGVAGVLLFVLGRKR